jgi:serine/threonine protein kinase
VNDQSGHAEPKNRQIEAALGEYLERVDRGELVDREEFLARHALIAGQLRSFIAADDEVRKLAGSERLQGAASSGEVGDAFALSRTGISAAPSGATEGQRFEMNNPQPAPDQLPKGMAPTASSSKPPEDVGSVIGPYKLLQKIGEGGFGMVYMAEQEKPVRRVVALKIIKPGMDTSQVIARFESERQALALMDHPNISRVLDAGATGSGHPYFVMELVKGVPITEFCDKNHMPPEARLKLFVDVCHAIQHAHHKGIIHRDIKPSNVMVTLHDGTPVVKVIDFGVAKATVQKLTERTLFTAYGQMIGTPAYMSPEQAEMSGLDIDTRSDVYSLGVLLYELLTGTTPLEAKRLREAAYVEMQRLIREEEAPRPSARLSSLGDTATVLAGNRGLDVKRLVQLLGGDLDWVVMKALEKDRNRRYATPGGFAEDIERYLGHEAISARPPSRAYRLKKLVQRNRAAVLTTAAVAVALLAGTAFSSWQAVRATRAETAAVVAAEAERKAKDAALIAAKAESMAKDAALVAAESERKAKIDAFKREAETKAVLGFVENRIFAAARPEGQEGGLGREVTLRKAIESALPYVNQSFPSQPLIEASLRLTLGRSFNFLGDARMAAEQEEAARTHYTRYLGPDHPDTLLSRDRLASSYENLGRLVEALRLREETLALRKIRLGPDDPDTLMSMKNLANSYYALGRFTDALKLNEKTLALRKVKLGPDHPDTLVSMNNLANSYVTLGRYADALKLYEATLARDKAKLGPDHPNTLAVMGNMANCDNYLARYADALRLYEESLALQKAKLGLDHPDTLISMNNVAESYYGLGRYAEALNLNEETLALRKAKLGPEHPDTLLSMNNLANNYYALGRYAAAFKLREQTLVLRKAQLGPNHPDTLMTMCGVAESLVAVHRGAEAVRLIDECVQLAAGKDVRPDLLPRVIDLRFRHFEQTKDAAGCRQTADMWEKLNRTEPNSLYKAACFRAVTAAVLRSVEKSAVTAHQADAEADRAMAWLKQAVAAGDKDLAHIKQDKDLDSLRARGDFKKLVAELEPVKRSEKEKP